MNAKRLLFIDVNIDDNIVPIELTLHSTPSENEVDDVTKLLKQKKKKLSAIPDQCFNYLRQSSIRPGKFVALGDDSPFKHNEQYMCIIQGIYLHYYFCCSLTTSLIFMIRS